MLAASKTQLQWRGRMLSSKQLPTSTFQRCYRSCRHSRYAQSTQFNSVQFSCDHFSLMSATVGDTSKDPKNASQVSASARHSQPSQTNQATNKPTNQLANQSFGQSVKQPSKLANRWLAAGLQDEGVHQEGTSRHYATASGMIRIFRPVHFARSMCDRTLPPLPATTFVAACLLAVLCEFIEYCAQLCTATHSLPSMHFGYKNRPAQQQPDMHYQPPAS